MLAAVYFQAVPDWLGLRWQSSLGGMTADGSGINGPFYSYDTGYTGTPLTIGTYADGYSDTLPFSSSGPNGSNDWTVYSGTAPDPGQDEADLTVNNVDSSNNLYAKMVLNESQSLLVKANSISGMFTYDNKSSADLSYNIVDSSTGNPVTVTFEGTLTFTAPNPSYSGPHGGGSIGMLDNSSLYFSSSGINLSYHAGQLTAQYIGTDNTYHSDTFNPTWGTTYNFQFLAITSAEHIVYSSDMNFEFEGGDNPGPLNPDTWQDSMGFSFKEPDNVP
jgi:hypothetical protein